MPGDSHSSKNICIPLNKGLSLAVLNEKPITASTRRIELCIKAEPGFDPQTDVDVNSLRFGAYNEVNFGRGCKVVKTRKQGDDLIVMFNGKGSGITSEEFAPKLIGRKKNGELLYGYASLPYVDYAPAILSARCPVYDAQQNVLKVKMINLGLSASELTDIEVFSSGKKIAVGQILALQPYEEKEFTLKVSEGLDSKPSGYEVVLSCLGKELDRTSFIF